jgi:hypothetical protein
MYRTLQALLVAGVACSIAACDRGSIVEDHEARGIANSYYRLIMDGRFSDAVNYFPIQDRALQLNQLRTLKGKVGALESYEIQSNEIHTVFRYRIHMYFTETRYTHGTAYETLTLQVNLRDKDDIHIVSHKVDLD